MRRNFPFNVLTAAQRVIRKQTIELRRFSGRDLNAAGKWVSTYETPVTVECNVQPVSRSLYQQMGLDFEKTYISILATPDIEDVGRDRSGDQIVIDSDLYESVGETDWQRSAGWNRIVAVRVGTV